MDNKLRKLRRQIAIQRRLGRLGQMALAGLDLTDLFGQALHFLVRSCRVSMCSIHSLNVEDDKVRVQMLSAIGWPALDVGRTVDMPRRNSLPGALLDNAGPLVIEDYVRQGISRSQLMAEQRVESTAADIIVGPQGVFGIVALHSRTQQRFSKRQVGLLHLVADLLSRVMMQRAARTEGDEQAFIVIDREERVRFWSRAAESLYQFTAGEAADQPLYELLRTEPAQRDEARRSLADQHRWEGHLRHRRKDGASIEVRSRQTGPSLHLDPPDGVLVIDADLSRQNAVHEALERRTRQTEALDTLTRTALQGAGCADLYRLACRLVGEVVQAECTTISHVERGRLMVQAVRGTCMPIGAAISEGDPCARALRQQEAVFEHGVHVPILQGGNGLGVISARMSSIGRHRAADADFMRSVADLLAVVVTRSRAETALQQAAGRYRALMAAARDAIILMRADGRIVDCNDSAEQIFQRTADELSELVINDLMDLGRPFPSAGCVQLLGRRPQAAAVPLEVVVSSDVDGIVTVIARDVTERLRAQAELRSNQEQLHQSQKMEDIGRLAGGVAHDFNNLLSAINGYSELLLMNAPPDASNRDELEEILAAGERAAALTRQLLAFSRRQILQPKVVRPSAVVADLHKMLRRLIGEDIELVSLLNDDACGILVDPGQLEQVIINLAVNARDAMPQGGTLTIAVSAARQEERRLIQSGEMPAGSYMEISVTDTGCGMDAVVMSRMFEPFFTTKEQGKGTGLGLSTVYGIVKQSEGHIDVQSKPGRGTRFRLYFPSTALTATEDQMAAAAPSNGSETVLIVEDEPQLRNLMTLSLRLSGYEVLEAGNGMEALSMADGFPRPIHLVVADVVMPKLGGQQLARELGRQRPETPVLFVSGYTDDSVLRHGVTQSKVHFLQKPFTPTDLKRRVREVLGLDNALPRNAGRGVSQTVLPELPASALSR